LPQGSPPQSSTARLRRLLPAAAAALLACSAGARAQDTSGDSGKALPLTVRPSGYDADAVASEARQRQERLLERMKRDDYLFRNICIQCGGGIRSGPGAYAPFNPIQALPGGSVPND
jgi:hypothetical protein